MLRDHKREITEAVYLRNKDQAYMSDEDMEQVFTSAELCGYGVYSAQVYAGTDGKYYVRYKISDSCD